MKGYAGRHTTAMVAAVQVNIRGGRVPKAEQDGVHYRRVLLSQFVGYSHVLRI